jgi:DNA-binding transcriptional LysR family regulator
MGQGTAEIATALSFRQLKLFESVGRLTSVRRASEECNLSQPAVTQSLAKLEQQIGASLLERRASGSYLNEYGTIFHRRTTRLFTLMEQALIQLGLAGGPGAAALVARRISRSQARGLIAIVDSGSFPEAARMLGVSQASLQRAAKDLEANVKKSLFYRTAAGVMVTPAGVEFGRNIKLAIQEIDWGLKEIDAARGDAATQLAIGALPFGGSVLLASVLDEFVSTHRDAEVRIINESASEMRKRLRAGDVDFVIGLVQEAQAEDLVSEPLSETPYAIVARRGHPLLRRSQVTAADLRGFEWVIGTDGASRRACFDRLFGSSPPKASIATCSLPVIRHLLSRSERLTLMTSYELAHENGELQAVPFGPLDPAPSIGMTMRANWLPTATHLAFMNMLRRQVKRTPATPWLRAIA